MEYARTLFVDGEEDTRERRWPPLPSLAGDNSGCSNKLTLCSLPGIHTAAKHVRAHPGRDDCLARFCPQAAATTNHAQPHRYSTSLTSRPPFPYSFHSDDSLPSTEERHTEPCVHVSHVHQPIWHSIVLRFSSLTAYANSNSLCERAFHLRG